MAAPNPAPSRAAVLWDCHQGSELPTGPSQGSPPASRQRQVFMTELDQKGPKHHGKVSVAWPSPKKTPGSTPTPGAGSSLPV